MLNRPAQAPSAVVMIRPHHFCSNPQTMPDNAYQTDNAASPGNSNTAEQAIAALAYQEVSHVAQQLTAHGVKVHLFEDESTSTPDSVFPNNWFSTHADGQIVIYPMYAPNRRLEYRADIIEFLQREYQVQAVHNYAYLAEQGLFVEGTGSLVIDHVHQLAYAVLSKRTDATLVPEICQQLKLTPVLFQAFDEQGLAVYHTNVMMCVASRFVLISLEMVPDAQRAVLLAHFAQSGQQVINLTAAQIRHFCGNALELTGSKGSLLALSQTAYQALSTQQITQISQFTTLLPLAVPTIESAGGSVRCMLAGIHLQPRSETTA